MYGDEVSYSDASLISELKVPPTRRPMSPHLLITRIRLPLLEADDEGGAGG